MIPAINLDWKEKQLYFNFSKAQYVLNFDHGGKGHKLTHDNFKAVDFILEDKNFYLFIEVKDLDNTNIPLKYREENIQEFLSSDLPSTFLEKFEDSLFYQSMDKGIPNKKFLYVILFNLTHPTFDHKIHFTTLKDQIFQKKSALKGGKQGWEKRFDILFVNLDGWNAIFPQYPVSRIESKNE